MITLGEAVTKYLAGRQERGELGHFTVLNYRAALKHFVRILDAETPVDVIGIEHMDEWWRTLKDRAASTRANHFSAVGCFARWLRKHGYTGVDLFDDLHSPRRPRHEPRYMETGSVGRLLAACPDGRARAIVEVMVGMGLRCKEVAGLEVGDWDRRAQVMLVRHGKGGHEREVPVPAAAARALDSYLAEFPVSSGPLFRSYRDVGFGISAHHVSVLVSRWMGEAGVKGCARDGRSAHALRHTCASDVLDRCRDVRVVMAMLGHRNLSTTQVYLRRARMEEMLAAMEGRDYGGAA